MAKERLCTNCTYNNNGWCNKRKTNKGLKDLTDCEFRKTSNMLKLEGYLEQKKFELEVENNSFNRGLIRGLEVAIKIINSDN